MLGKRMGGINWTEVPPILAIGGDATVTDGCERRRPGRLAWADASALTTDRRRWLPVAATRISLQASGRTYLCRDECVHSSHRQSAHRVPVASSGTSGGSRGWAASALTTGGSRG